MKYSTIVALFLGTAVAHGHHHRHHKSESEECTGLCAKYKAKYENLLKKEHAIASEFKHLESRFFADGYENGEKFNETIHVNDGDDGKVYEVNYPQRHTKAKFAEGYADDEEMGETITSKGPSGMVEHSYSKRKPSSAHASYA